MRELALSYGVLPSYGEFKKNRLKIMKSAIQSLINDNTIRLNDLVIYVGGRYGRGSEASYMEISTAIKLYKSASITYSKEDISENQ